MTGGARPAQALASLAAFITGHFAPFLSRTPGWPPFSAR
jgi:hypothetical protein